MRILLAVTLFAAACGTPPKPKAVADEESTPTCCCKTLPSTAEKEIVPNYAQTGRMDCSAARGDCVDDVQCSATEGGTQQAQPSNDGVPPPPTLEPSTTSGGI